MKNKLFFLLALPLTWFLIAIVTACEAADKVWLLSVAPSVWLTLFKTSSSITVHQFQFGGLPVMFLVGLVLLKLKMKPRVMIISAVVITFILWLALAVPLSQSRVFKVPGAPFVWILCCFNFSLCFLPFLALIIKLTIKFRRSTSLAHADV
jgi:hypothetical protein